MKDNWETIIPKKSNNHLNEWADYIELKCLLSRDIVSKNDILDIITDSHIVDTDDYLIDDNMTPSERYMLIIDDAFSLIEYRMDVLGDYYPFIIECDCLKLKCGFNILESAYVFLLLASSTRQVSDLHGITTSFEKLCGALIETSLFVNNRTIITGTSTTRKKNVYDAVSDVAKLLKLNLTKSFEDAPRYKSSSGGDGGVDIVSVYDIADDNHFLPTTFCQCTCSRDEWIKKQNDVSHGVWSRRIADLVEFIRIMFVPFSLCGADGKYENIVDIRSCVMDRHRIILQLERTEINYKCLVENVIKQEIGTLMGTT